MARRAPVKKEIKKLNLSVDQIIEGITSLLKPSSYIQVNRSTAKLLGCNDYAIILSVLIEQWHYLKSQNSLNIFGKRTENNPVMYFTSKQAYEKANVCKKTFVGAIKLFAELKFLKVYKVPGDSSNYYFLDIKQIVTWLFSNKPNEDVHKNDQKKTFRKSLKAKVENRTMVQLDLGVGPNGTTNDKKDDIYKTSINDKNPVDLSLIKRQNVIVFFDPKQYIFRDGSRFTPWMVNAIKKYSAEDRDKLISNILWYENQLDSGACRSIKTSHEQYLQWAINNNMASKADKEFQNELYARIVQGENNLEKVIDIKARFVKVGNFTIKKDKSVENFAEELLTALEKLGYRRGGLKT
jgi:hypothetical protein